VSQAVGAVVKVLAGAVFVVLPTGALLASASAARSTGRPSLKAWGALVASLAFAGFCAGLGLG
jgi:hypothetical protein